LTSSLISVVSYFNMGVVDVFGRAKLKKLGDGTEFWVPYDSVGPPN